MTDHVAVLRAIRNEFRTLPRKAALDHAIATCEQHAALVARLGELEKGWRSQGETWGPSGGANARQVCADDLARVVKEGNHG